MRRPLALACALFATAICLCLSIWVPEGNRYLALSGKTVTLSGTVTSKEYKRSNDGSLKLLVTVKDVSLESGNEKALMPSPTTALWGLATSLCPGPGYLHLTDAEISFWTVSASCGSALRGFWTPASPRRAPL